MLFEMGPSLSRFESLKYLTFMAPGTGISLDNEGAAATLWHKACPTLKTIILPRGVVWALTDGKWSCLEDDTFVASVSSSPLSRLMCTSFRQTSTAGDAGGDYGSSNPTDDRARAVA